VILQVLIACPVDGKPLTHQACRRRQLERRLVEDEKTRKKRPGPPAREHCASGTCAKGAEVAAALEAEDVSSATCPKCGTAYVGPEADRPCPECAPFRAQGPERRAEYSARLWVGEVPNTGIAPPARRDVGLTPEDIAATAARVRLVASGRRPRPAPAFPPRVADPAEPQAREVAPDSFPRGPSSAGPGLPATAAAPVQQGGTPPAPPAPVHTAPPPATPAEEETMPKGYARGAACKSCGATGPRHKKACPEDGAKPAAAPKAKAAPVPRAAKVRAVRAIAGEDLDEMPVEQLVERRDAYDAAIDRRVALVEEELAALKAAASKARARAEAA
jgi:hypothetical protein